MMRLKPMVIAIAPMLLLFACAKPSQDTEADRRELMQLSREWSALATSGDLDTVVNYWAENAVILPPDMAPIEGRQAIKAYVQSSRAMPGFRIRWEPVSAHISESGDLAYMIERNVVEFDDPSGNHVVAHGKVVTIWRKDPSTGQWRNVVDIWNAAPAPAE